jgi:lysophospholipid acyltransferase (LPLAT)-like uncharacterized protein
MDHDSADIPKGQKIPLDPVSALILVLGTVLGHTWRYRITGSQWIDPFNDKGSGVIYCFWHSHILPLTFIFRNTAKFAVVSASSDGRRAAAVAQRWKHGIIDGSASRGGTQALRRSAQILKNKGTICLTPDGPRGPREIVKPGVAQLAILAGAPIVTSSARPRSAWRLRSWDRFMIPKPFTFIDVSLGEPIFPEGLDADTLTKKIQERLMS